ncbi:killer cell lectin-like receptor subfamily F member 1 [Gopherus evgoodei]|uniref:killer cell lectin-like receptor subfamily F member 1 n=1 Tax=Gopherus evgoodei TaxID=1825980 RepID=UPI0011CF53BB|nr:killer cell lectin-like receptor subfamily F member 1 [Gopherus evgoodei]
MEDEEGYTVLNLRPKQRQPGCPLGVGPQDSLQCPHWIRIALGVGWAGNIVLLATVIALGVRVFQLQVPCEERTRAAVNIRHSDGASHRPTNGTKSDTGQEDFLSHLKQFLCEPTYSSSPEGSSCRLCPTEWLMHEGKCYWASKESQIWHKSHDDCSAKSSRLLVIQDQKEMDFISSVTQDTNPVWLGLTMTPPEWKWTWLDNSLLDQTLFPVVGPGERNSCGVIKGKQIHSETCNAVVKWICEKEAILM